MTTSVQAIDTRMGERIHQMLWLHRITNTDAAKATGIDRTALSKKLRGTRPWYFHEVAAIAGLLNSSVGYLYGETNNPHLAGGPDGGCSVCAARDSNPEPADAKESCPVLRFPGLDRSNPLREAA